MRMNLNPKVERISSSPPNDLFNLYVPLMAAEVRAAGAIGAREEISPTLG